MRELEQTGMTRATAMAFALCAILSAASAFAQEWNRPFFDAFYRKAPKEMGKECQAKALSAADKALPLPEAQKNIAAKPNGGTALRVFCGCLAALALALFLEETGTAIARGCKRCFNYMCLKRAIRNKMREKALNVARKIEKSPKGADAMELASKLEASVPGMARSLIEIENEFGIVHLITGKLENGNSNRDISANNGKNMKLKK